MAAPTLWGPPTLEGLDVLEAYTVSTFLTADDEARLAACSIELLITKDKVQEFWQLRRAARPELLRIAPRRFVLRWRNHAVCQHQ